MVKQLKHNELPELRDKLLKQQKGICPICKRIIEDPVLDHHHMKRIKGTGLIRGVLCRQCNVMLGKIENNCSRYGISQEELPAILTNMSRYIRRKHKPYRHPSAAEKPCKLMKSSYNELAQAIKADGRYKVPQYPKSGQLTKELRAWFEKLGIEPKFYSK